VKTAWIWDKAGENRGKTGEFRGVFGVFDFVSQLFSTTVPLSPLFLMFGFGYGPGVRGVKRHTGLFEVLHSWSEYAPGEGNYVQEGDEKRARLNAVQLRDGAGEDAAAREPVRRPALHAVAQVAFPK
jgi:hypothetical protein